MGARGRQRRGVLHGGQRGTDNSSETLSMTTTELCGGGIGSPKLDQQYSEPFGNTARRESCKPPPPQQQLLLYQ
jgi:hypothetical protein